ncbi:hypothetical protein [Sphingomonas sp. RT2P30]|uniref:hypothetical protein n=1 Tax=Parasphingomonas halimpatiens TaxID=3096162 RepID=UPI002FCCB67E
MTFANPGGERRNLSMPAALTVAMSTIGCVVFGSFSDDGSAPRPSGSMIRPFPPIRKTLIESKAEFQTLQTLVKRCCHSVQRSGRFAASLSPSTDRSQNARRPSPLEGQKVDASLTSRRFIFSQARFAAQSAS